MLPERHQGLVLFNPINKQYIDQFDEFVYYELNARVFDSILSADAHAAWYEQVYGVQLYLKQWSGK